jgi:hypothetical protein
MTFDPTARFEKFDNKVDSALEHIRDYKFVKVVFSIAAQLATSEFCGTSLDCCEPLAVLIAFNKHWCFPP